MTQSLSVARWVLVFLFATPLLTSANPVVGGVPNAPTPVQIAARQPTRRMGQRKIKKAAVLTKKDYSAFLCPGGAVACPVPPADLGEVTPESIAALDTSLDSLAAWFKLGFECMELATELNSCGGCLALGAGQDCTSIPNARATGCEESACVVYSCFDGWIASSDKKTCVRKGTSEQAQSIISIV